MLYLFLGINLDLDPCYHERFAICALFLPCSFLSFMLVTSCHILMQVDDIQRPLVAGDLGIVESQSSESTVSYSIEQTDHQTHENFSSSYSSDVSPKQRILSTSSKLTHSNRC